MPPKAPAEDQLSGGRSGKQHLSANSRGPGEVPVDLWSFAKKNEVLVLLVLNAGNGWVAGDCWDYGSFPHFLLSTSK